MSAKFGKGGNMFFQVEEAEKSMKAHLEYIASAQPNKEIRDSKKPVIRFEKQNGKQRVMLKERERQNKLLMQRVYSIMHEERRPGSREYAPGYRVTSQGIPVIDCYPTELYVAKNFSKLHNAGVDRERRQKIIDKENKILHKHLVNVRSPYNAKDLFKDYERKHRLQNGVKKLPHTALHLLHASHPKSPPIRARSASPPSRKNRDNSKSSSSGVVQSKDGKFHFPKDKAPQPEWNNDIKIQYSDVKRRPKSATYDRRGELKPLPGPSGPLQLSEEANMYVNFNMRQQNRPKSAHASTSSRSRLPPFSKAFPLPHMNYPTPPDDIPRFQFPAPSAIRDAINKNFRSGLSTVSQVSAPVNMHLHGGVAKAPASNVPVKRRPKSAGRSTSKRFNNDLNLDHRDDAILQDTAVEKLDGRDPSVNTASHSSAIRKSAATSAAVAVKKIFGESSTCRKNGVANSSSSVTPKDGILTSTEDKGLVIEGDVLSSLRERYPPRRVILQQCSVLPRIKFSGGSNQRDIHNQKFGGSLNKMYFDIRVVDVGVICPIADLPGGDKLAASVQTDHRLEGIIGAMRSITGQKVSSIPTSTGILIEAESSTSSASACSLFIPMRHLKNLSVFYKRNDILKFLKSIPARDKKAGLYASMGEYMNASEEGELASLVLQAVEIIYDPSTVKGKIVIRQPSEEDIQNVLRQRPGSGKGVEGIGAKGFQYTDENA